MFANKELGQRIKECYKKGDYVSLASIGGRVSGDLQKKCVEYLIKLDQPDVVVIALASIGDKTLDDSIKKKCIDYLIQNDGVIGAVSIAGKTESQKIKDYTKQLLIKSGYEFEAEFL